MVITAQNRELKPGYKQTEVGIIPGDWVVKTLGEIVNKERPICYGIVQTGKSIDDGVPCIRVVDLSNGKVSKENLITTSKEISNSYKRTILKEGDLVIALRGKIGELAIIDKELIGFNLTRGVALIAVSDLLDSSFFLQQLSSYKSKVIFEKNLNGSALQEIPINVLRKIPVTYPYAKSEQTAIATVLSDIDSLITSLDKLITKKRDIKQATMQQLLTGKTRLLGFDEKWEMKKIGDVFNVTAGGDFDLYQSSSIQDEIHCHPIYSNALSNNGLYGFCSYNNHQAGSITVTARGTLGVANFRDHHFTAIGRVLVLQPNMSMDGRFFAEFINNQIDFVVESTGVPQLTAPQISKYELPIPPLPEQRTIATVLSDMDAEITALEQKRDKTRALKQGMMQELLTGKTRLV